MLGLVCGGEIGVAEVCGEVEAAEDLVESVDDSYCGCNPEGNSPAVPAEQRALAGESASCSASSLGGAYMK